MQIHDKKYIKQIIHGHPKFVFGSSYVSHTYFKRDIVTNLFWGENCKSSKACSRKKSTLRTLKPNFLKPHHHEFFIIYQMLKFNLTPHENWPACNLLSKITFNTITKKSYYDQVYFDWPNYRVNNFISFL